MRTHLALLLLVGCSTPPAGSRVDDVDAMSPSSDAEPDGTPIDPATSPHLTLGIPTDGSPADDLLLVHPQFAASYNRYLNEANWVSWRTRPSDFGPAPRYAGAFYPDTMLPAGMFRVDTDAYYGPGYDRDPGSGVPMDGQVARRLVHEDHKGAIRLPLDEALPVALIKSGSAQEVVVGSRRQPNGSDMIGELFGERQGFADETGTALATRVASTRPTVA